MNSLRKPLVIAAALIATAALAGCGNDPSQPGSAAGTTNVFEVTTPGGETVVCITWKNGYAGGLSCDWDGADR